MYFGKINVFLIDGWSYVTICIKKWMDNKMLRYALATLGYAAYLFKYKFVLEKLILHVCNVASRLSLFSNYFLLTEIQVYILVYSLCSILKLGTFDFLEVRTIVKKETEEVC